jgi:hypothetical protein
MKKVARVYICPGERCKGHLLLLQTKVGGEGFEPAVIKGGTSTIFTQLIICK